MKSMTENQKVLYDIATDPDKAERFFINLGADKYIRRFYILCGFCIGLVLGVVLG